MNETRLKKLLNIMEREGLDGAFFATGPNFQYILDCTNLKWQRLEMNNIMGISASVVVPDCLLYVKNTGEYHLFVIPSRKDDFKEEKNVHVYYMDRMLDGIERVIEGHKFMIDMPAKEHIITMFKEFMNYEIEVFDGEKLMRELRTYKDEKEIAILEDNARFTDKAIEWVITQFKEGMTQYEIEDILMQYAFEQGVPDFSFDPTIGFCTRGSEHAKELSFDHNRTLVEGTGIAFDIGFVRNGYCSDWGRTLFWGEAPEFLKKGYEALQAGQLNMIKNIVPGKTNINELYGFVHEEVKRRGYEEYLRFKDRGSLGHQIGIECHEFPMLNNSVDFVLQPGMVFCSEPKLWFPNEVYMRVEDMVLVTEDGARSLSQFDRELFEIKGK